MYKPQLGHFGNFEFFKEFHQNIQFDSGVQKYRDHHCACHFLILIFFPLNKEEWRIYINDYRKSLYKRKNGGFIESDYRKSLYKIYILTIINSL